MRNYDREYIQKYCRKLITTIGEFNRVHTINDKNVISVRYNKIPSGLQKGRFYGLDLKCNLKKCGISRIVIEPMEDDRGYTFDVYDRKHFTHAYTVDYRLGYQARHVIDTYVSKWLNRIDGLLQGKKFKHGYFKNDWHDDYFDTLNQLNKLHDQL